MTDIEKIFDRCIPEPNSGCWLWLGRVEEDGYGVASTRPYWSAHRLSYTLHCGEIPPGGLVLHSCDQPSCINPDHLRVGTVRENAADRVKRGRNNPGRTCKLKESEVKAIRADPRPNKAVAKEYGVHFTMIGKIRNRVYWKHVA